jgi:hypothetical protein
MFPLVALLGHLVSDNDFDLTGATTSLLVTLGLTIFYISEPIINNGLTFFMAQTTLEAAAAVFNMRQAAETSESFSPSKLLFDSMPVFLLFNCG